MLKKLQGVGMVDQEELTIQQQLGIGKKLKIKSMDKEIKEKLIVELNYLLEIINDNSNEKKILLEDLINKIYYDQF